MGKHKSDSAPHLIAIGVIILLSAWAVNWVVGQLYVWGGFSWVTISLLSTISLFAALAGVTGIVLVIVGLVRLFR